MHMTPEELRDLLSLAGSPRHITDVMVARLTSTAAPSDSVVLVLDSRLWGNDLELGRVAASLTRAGARHLHRQLGQVLAELEAGDGQEQG